MEQTVPSAGEHFRMLIVVRQFGYRSATTFNRLFERLQRVQSLQAQENIRLLIVSDNPRRMIVANFVSSVNSGLVKFGELQAHRRVIGLVGIVHAPPLVDEHASTSQDGIVGGTLPQTIISSIDDNSTIRGCGNRKPSATSTLSLPQIKQQYESTKEEYSSTLVDSRCIAIGYSNESLSNLWSSRELFSFGCLEDADSLENGVREFLRSIFFVLESRRLDLSFEKLESPPYPFLPDEQKYRMGLENKTSKQYKRRCVGRLRKQVADYTLLTGLPTLALDAYQASIDLLKQAGDLLWLAAAYEGWACAAMTIKYELDEECRSLNCMQRISTLTPDQMRALHEKSQHSLGVSLGHQRHRSDTEQVAGTMSSAAAQLIAEEQQRRAFRLPWNSLHPDRSSSGKNSINHSEIVDKFKMALENYERFSFAAFIEYECMMKAASVFRFQRLYVDMQAFIREHVGKYLDDSFTLFDHITKANICLNCAAVYRMIGFKRKYAFFARLAVLFRLHITEGETRTAYDYRQVYPTLYRTLSGYGIPENPKDMGGDLSVMGPAHVQRRALHEVFMSALRAEHRDAAIRHLCCLLQVYYEQMDAETAARMLDELAHLVCTSSTQHQLNQHITLPQCGIIIPPVQMTRFPKLEKFAVCALPAHLAPVVIRPRMTTDIFIYSPFQVADNASKAIFWVVDCACEVSVSVSNCLPFELSVNNLSLLSEGCALETVPVRLNLAPCSDSVESVDIKLIGVPRAPGKLTITGYSCEVLGVRSVCRLRDLPLSANSAGNNSHSSVFEVEVLPALPVLELQTSLPRAPISEEDMEPTAETTVYSGQTFEHTISIVNASKTIAIRDMRLEIRQPKVCGGPCLIELVDDWFKDVIPEDETNESQPSRPLRRLEPLERKHIKFRIFGIDPSATTDDGSRRGPKEVVHEDADLGEPSTEGTHDRIPFTGRLLTSEFVFRYTADINGAENEQYERHCRLPLAVSIVPAVTVSAWHVLPGDGPTTRYVVVDVTNSTEWDAELTYGKGKLIGVQPREICRVPLLCECCSDVASNAFQQAASLASHMMQMHEMEQLRLVLERHVSAHLDIRWSINNGELSGSVPVGPILSSISLLKQLVVPAISIEMSVNGIPYVREDDVVVGIGEVLDLELRLISSIKDDRSFSGLLRVDCFRDLQNGTTFIDSNENVIVLNAESVPFTLTRERTMRVTDGDKKAVDTLSIENDYAPNASENETTAISNVDSTTSGFSCTFSLVFRYEGLHKVKPIITLVDGSSQFSDEELFCSAISVNVITKVC
uniref:Trafficking protein particle complex subunit 11 domain-containing protein n=1 Tax=Ascaris lumbricoides TaxID=6252 RepID=A0A9J2PDJ2_ASCLU